MSDQMKPTVEVHGNQAWLLVGPHTVRMDAGDAWDLGDDLLIAAGQIWQDGTGKPYDPDWPEALVDQAFLDERATGILFTEEQMADLRVLATARGKTLPQLIREEMLATLEFTNWDHKFLAEVDVAEDAERENGDTQAQPAVPEPEPDTETVADTHSSGDQVQDDRER